MTRRQGTEACNLEHRKMSGYRDLEIYKLAFGLAIDVHKMTMTLPTYEMYEQGSQIRRSTKSIKNNNAEGYGSKRYSAEFVRFLVFAHASCDEAMSPIEMISKIHFEDKPLTSFMEDYTKGSKMIYKYMMYIEKSK